MCELNHKYSRKFIVEFFDAGHFANDQEFEQAVMERILRFELEANELGIYRCHVHEAQPFEVKEVVK